MQPTEVDPSASSELDWRRPHPITILVELGRALRSVIVALAVVSGGFINRGSLVELVLVAAPLIGALARWYTTRYALDEESIHHQYGLIWRKKQVLPRANVQNVSTKAGLFARMTSVVELQISDASADGDLNIRYVVQDEAERLTALLRSSAVEFRSGESMPTDTVGLGEGLADGSTGASLEASASAPAPSGPAVPIDNILVEPTAKQLFEAELRTLSAVGFVSIGLLALVVGIATVAEGSLVPDDAGGVAWIVVVLVGLAPIAVALFQAVVTVLMLGGFRLAADPDRLRIQSGLVTEARITARRERIQQIRVQREILHRRSGLERVAFETADVEVSTTPGTRFLAPIGPSDGWRSLAAEVFGEVQLDESQLQPVSELTSRRAFVRFVITSVPLLVLALLHPLAPLPAIVAWLGFGAWFSRARYRELGWAVGPDQYLIRRGVLWGRLTLVRLDKIQSTRLEASFFQRRLGLATVKVSTAGRGFGGLASLPDLPRNKAEALLARLSHRAAETPIAETL